MNTRHNTPERIAKEMLLAGASGRDRWCREAEAARRRRGIAPLVRDVAAAVAAITVIAFLLWAASRGLDCEGGWSVGDYRTTACWNDAEAGE